MEDKVKETEVEATPEKVGGCSSEDADFEVDAEDYDEKTQSPKETEVVVDLGISIDEEFRPSDKTKVEEQDVSPAFVQRQVEDFKKDCEKNFVGINEKIDVLNNKFNMAIIGLELGVVVSVICKVHKEMMRKVVFEVINGKIKLRKASQTKEEKCGEIKSVTQIENQMEEIKYLNEDFENINQAQLPFSVFLAPFLFSDGQRF